MARAVVRRPRSSQPDLVLSVDALDVLQDAVCLERTTGMPWTLAELASASKGALSAEAMSWFKATLEPAVAELQRGGALASDRPAVEDSLYFESYERTWTEDLLAEQHGAAPQSAEPGPRSRRSELAV